MRRAASPGISRMSSVARASSSTAARGSSIDSRNLATSSAAGKTFLLAVFRAEISSVLLISARRPMSEALPRASSETRVPSLNFGRLVDERVQLRGGGPEVHQQRGLLAGEVAELGHDRLQLEQEVVEQVEVLGELDAARGRDAGGVLGLVDEPDDVLAALGQAGEDRVGVRVQLGDDRVLAAEDLQHLAQLAQGRGAGADRGVQVLGVADQAGPELVDDQLQAAVERLAQGVLDEVVLDRGLVVGGRDRAPRAARRRCRAGSR